MRKRLLSVFIILAVLFSVSAITSFAEEVEQSGDGWHYYNGDYNGNCTGWKLDIWTSEAYASFKAGTLIDSSLPLDFISMQYVTISTEITESTPAVYISGDVTVENGGKLTFNGCNVSVGWGDDYGKIYLNGTGALVIDGGTEFFCGGQIFANNNSTITVKNGTLDHCGNGIVLNNNAKLTIESGSKLINSGNINTCGSSGITVKSGAVLENYCYIGAGDSSVVDIYGQAATNAFAGIEVYDNSQLNIKTGGTIDINNLNICSNAACTVDGTMNNKNYIQINDNSTFKVTGTLNNCAITATSSEGGGIDVNNNNGLVLSGKDSVINNSGCLRVGNSGSSYGGYADLVFEDGATTSNVKDTLQIRFGWMDFNEEGEVTGFDAWFNVYGVKGYQRDPSVLVGYDFAGGWKLADPNDVDITFQNCYYYLNDNGDRILQDEDGNFFISGGTYEGNTLESSNAVYIRSWQDESGEGNLFMRQPDWGAAKITITLKKSIDGLGEAGTKGYTNVYTQLDYAGFYWENNLSEDTVIEGSKCAIIPGIEFWYICQDGFDADNINIWAYIYGNENDDYFDEELDVCYNEEENCYDFWWGNELFMKGEIYPCDTNQGTRYSFRLFNLRSVYADVCYRITLNIDGQQNSLELNKPTIWLETDQDWYAPGDIVTAYVKSSWLHGFAGLNLDLIFDSDYLELVDDPVTFNSVLTETGTQVNTESNVFDTDEGRVLRVAYSNNENIDNTYNDTENNEYLYKVQFRLTDSIPADFTLDTELVIRCAPDPKTGEVDAINNVCDKDMHGLYPYFYNTCVSTMVIGDVCRDNCCNIKDAVRIAQAVADRYGYGITDVEYASCDVNDDGNVDINDIITMLQFLCGKRSRLGNIN